MTNALTNRHWNWAAKSPELGGEKWLPRYMAKRCFWLYNQENAYFANPEFGRSSNLSWGDVMGLLRLFVFIVLCERVPPAHGEHVPISKPLNFIVGQIKVEPEFVWFLAQEPEGCRYGAIRFEKKSKIWTVIPDPESIAGMANRPASLDPSDVLPPDLAKEAAGLGLSFAQDEDFDWYGGAEFGESGESYGAGIFQYDRKRSSWKRFVRTNSGLPADPVFSLARDGEVLWIGTNHGIARWNTSSNRWQYFGVTEVEVTAPEAEVTLGEPGTPFDSPIDYPVLFRAKRGKRLRLSGMRQDFRIFLDSPVDVWSQTEISHPDALHSNGGILRTSPSNSARPVGIAASLGEGLAPGFTAVNLESNGWHRVRVNSAWIGFADVRAVVSEVTRPTIEAQMPFQAPELRAIGGGSAQKSAVQNSAIPPNQQPTSLASPSYLDPNSAESNPMESRRAAFNRTHPQNRPVSFDHEDADAKEVYLLAPFLVRSGGRQLMTRGSNGVWTTTAHLSSGRAYRYRYEVVGIGGKHLTPVETINVPAGE